jgi:hypothetical protein
VGGKSNREIIMPKRKTDEQYAVLGRKDCWHTYGLQALGPNKFAKVVSDILTGKFSLVTSKTTNRTTIRPI